VVDRLIFADASPRGEQGIENSNRQVLVKQRPAGAPTVEDFEIADGPLPDPADGEVLVRAIYLSLDPHMRGRISAARSYAKPVDVGAVVEGRVVGHVVWSRDPGFREGDYVLGGYGWQLYSAVPGEALLKLEPAEAPLPTALGVLGMRGMTAFIGLDEIVARNAAKRSSYRRPQEPSERWPGSSPSAAALARSVLPAEPRNAVLSSAGSGSTAASTTARPTSAARSTRLARTRGRSDENGLTQ
jgi:NADPH:quinone reductase-like Zn-dependent oxidoreductase